MKKDGNYPDNKWTNRRWKSFKDKKPWKDDDNSPYINDKENKDNIYPEDDRIINGKGK